MLGHTRHALLAVQSFLRRLWSMRIQYSILISQMGGAAVEGVLVTHRVTNLIGQEPGNFLGCGAFSLEGGKSPSQTGMNWSSYVTPHSVKICGALQWIIPLGNVFRCQGIMDP